MALGTPTRQVLLAPLSRRIAFSAFVRGFGPQNPRPTPPAMILSAASRRLCPTRFLGTRRGTPMKVAKRPHDLSPPFQRRVTKHSTARCASRPQWKQESRITSGHWWTFWRKLSKESKGPDRESGLVLKLVWASLKTIAQECTQIEGSHARGSKRHRGAFRQRVVSTKTQVREGRRG